MFGIRRSRHCDGQDAEFGLGHVQPASVFWRVVPLEAFDRPARFSGRKGFVERSRLVGVEIVLHQHDLRDIGKVRVRQVLENLRIIDRGVAIGHLDMPPAVERREHHEQIGGAVTLILIIIIIPFGVPWLGSTPASQR